MALRDRSTSEALAQASGQAVRALALAQEGFLDDPAATALLLRVSQLMAQKLARPGGPLQQASHDPATLALDDLGLLSELVIQAWRGEEQPLNREWMLRLRGERALAQLLKSRGGTLRAAEVAELLGVGEDTVRKRRERKLLLGVKRGKHTLYPVFQFDQRNRRVWPGVEQVLPMLDTASGSAQLRFLLSPDAELEGCPADHLCCDRPTGLELIACRARQFGQHLAR